VPADGQGLPCLKLDTVNRRFRWLADAVISKLSFETPKAQLAGANRLAQPAVNYFHFQKENVAICLTTVSFLLY
jgi:hypothetical protein